MTSLPCRFLTGLATLLALAAPVFAEDPPPTKLPMTDAVDRPAGLAKPFFGNWSVVRPGGSNSVLTCGLPTVISGNGDDRLTYRDVGNREHAFTVTAGDGKTNWNGQDAQQDDQTAVWTGPDSFILYPHFDDGTLDLEYAMLYERCEIWPRKSFDGAVAGALEPFVGNWSESLPADRGGHPIETRYNCDDPSTYAIAGEHSLTLSSLGGTPETINVDVRDGETVFPKDGLVSVVIWVSPDRWHLHLPGLNGDADWNRPIILTRCP